MERQRIVAFVYAVTGLYFAARGTSDLLASGVSVWPVLSAACGLLMLVALARSVARGDIDDEFDAIVENDALFWSLVAAGVLYAALVLFDVFGSVPVLS
ncbi:hypothetical protein SAMN04488063_2534 [Halopelagius inordinatus]|uniref:Uncharacterized protein n=1 Tax=Halopelagius inordinatus TaxID=553467 RepID=A0A1I2T924_9EURY|nr:hypothetical protein [Halopelagius inordinatus]SFG59737.1 hypothetical protein SAMN04488063_2534 [Halopelagius inordinatus]